MVPSEAVSFIYLASVCRSLQCLISVLTQAGGGGLLFSFASSILLRAGRGAADRYRCVWRTLTAFRPHWVCPHLWPVLSPSTLLRLPAALYGAGPALYAVPVFGHSTKARTRLGLCFVLSPAGAAQAARSLMGALSRVRRAFFPPGSLHQFPRTPVGCVRLVSVLRS